jgi:hypothetical protein
LGTFLPLNITPLGYLLSKNESGYQKLDYIKLRIILLLLRYGANPDFIESGMLSSREMLDIIGYTINNGHLETKSSSVNDTMDMEIYEFDANMDETNNVIEFKDNIDTIITID